MSQAEHQLSLTHIYAGWDVYQQRLVEAIAPLTAEQLALRNSPQHWSVGMLVAHIVATRIWWFYRGMGVGKPELVPLESWDRGFEDRIEEPVRPAAELIAGLGQSWQMIQETLADLNPTDLEKVFPNPHGEERPARSRQWIIWHVLEHDIHHGGEISSILGTYGLAAVNLD